MSDGGKDPGQQTLETGKTRCSLTSRVKSADKSSVLFSCLSHVPVLRVSAC